MIRTAMLKSQAGEYETRLGGYLTPTPCAQPARVTFFRVSPDEIESALRALSVGVFEAFAVGLEYLEQHEWRHHVTSSRKSPLRKTRGNASCRRIVNKSKGRLVLATGESDHYVLIHGDGWTVVHEDNLGPGT